MRIAGWSLWTILTIAALFSGVGSAFAGEGDYPTFAIDSARRSCPDGSRLMPASGVRGLFKPEAPASYNGIMYADALTGKRIRQFRNVHPDSGPLLWGKVLVFGTGCRDSGVGGVEADAGRKNWHVPVKLACPGTPSASLDGQVFYVGTGESRWSEKVHSGPAHVLVMCVAGGRVWYRGASQP